MRPSEILIQPQYRTIAPGNYYYNNGTDDRTSLNLYGLLIEEGCVFSTLEIDGEDVLSKWNFSNNTISRDIFTSIGKKITKYTLSSGAVLELSY